MINLQKCDQRVLKTLYAAILILPFAMSRIYADEPACWLKVSFMDFTMQVPAVLEVKCLDLAFGRTPAYGFGVGASLADIGIFYSPAPEKRGSHMSMFPVSVYYTPAIRWTAGHGAKPVTMFFLTYGRDWFPEDDSESIANQNYISSGFFVSWQKFIHIGLKASMIYTFSDDGQTKGLGYGVGGILSLGIFKGIGKRNIDQY